MKNWHVEYIYNIYVQYQCVYTFINKISDEK